MELMVFIYLLNTILWQNVVFCGRRPGLEELPKTLEGVRAGNNFIKMRQILIARARLHEKEGGGEGGRGKRGVKKTDFETEASSSIEKLGNASSSIEDDNSSDGLEVPWMEPETDEGSAASGVADATTCLILYPCKSERSALEECKTCDECGSRTRTSGQKEISCYSDDPEPFALVDGGGDEGDTVKISEKKVLNNNDGFEGAGFIIPEQKLYRSSKLFRNDSNEDGVEMEFMDWPGSHIKDYLEKATASQKVAEDTGELQPCMQVLEYEGRSTSYFNYACNTMEGLDVSALGLLPTLSDQEAREERILCNLGIGFEPMDNRNYNRYINLLCNQAMVRDFEKGRCVDWPTPEGKFYFASGKQSMVRDYVQPFAVNEDILRKLTRDPDDPETPSFEGIRLGCTTEYSEDIRTVLTFAFSTNRLILGMKCGVLFIDKITNEKYETGVAYLKSQDRVTQDPNEPVFHKFPYMINVVSSTPSCATYKKSVKLEPLVAIYSSYAAYHTDPDDYQSYVESQRKVIYVSWDNGDTFDGKFVASLNGIMNVIYWMYNKISKSLVKDTYPPTWVRSTNIMAGGGSLGVLNWEEHVDPLAPAVLQGTKLMKENQEEEDHCFEIVSLVAIVEESLLTVLCRGSGMDVNNIDSSKYYGIYRIPLKSQLPFVTPYRKSRRKFFCKPTKSVHWITKDRKSVEPIMGRIPMSYSIFISGCMEKLYYSSNAGRTIFKTYFYQNRKEGSESEAEYIRTTYHQGLNTQPIFASHPSGSAVGLTFGSYFAYGVVSSHEGLSLVGGPVLNMTEFMPLIKNPKPTYIPYFDDSGRFRVGIILLPVLKNAASKGNLFGNYARHHSIRLLDTGLNFHKFAMPFYKERGDILPEFARVSMEACSTFGFVANTSEMSMDVGESQSVRVEVKNDEANLQLHILLTHNKAASLEVSVPSIKQEEHIMLHAWDVRLMAKPHIIDPIETEINAFFGASYSNLEEVTAHLIMGSPSQTRCHAQPRAHVSVRFGCNKYLTIHEDSRRPQCPQFRKNYRYEIPQGHFDEQMAAYWIREYPQFYQIVNGTLKVTYHYGMFGCPVQPYRLDAYVPDLRLMNVGADGNTTEGVKFNGTYVLIEIFQASGYTFSKKVLGNRCNKAPQTLDRMVKAWKARVQAIRALWKDYPKFDENSVYEPLNIWNRVNYRDCRGEEEESMDADTEGIELPYPEYYEEEVEEPLAGGDQRELLEAPYEILRNAGPEDERNSIVWDSRIRQKVYIFLAVAVDPFDTYCNYHTYFGLSLNEFREDDDVPIFFVFLGTLILGILLIVGGYYVHGWVVYGRMYKKALYNRLLTAAWNLSFRIEKRMTLVEEAESGGVKRTGRT